MAFYVQAIDHSGDYATDAALPFESLQAAIDAAGADWAASATAAERGFHGRAHRVVDDAGRMCADPLDVWTDPDGCGDPVPAPMTEEV